MKKSELLLAAKPSGSASGNPVPGLGSGRGQVPIISRRAPHGTVSRLRTGLRDTWTGTILVKSLPKRIPATPARFNAR